MGGAIVPTLASANAFTGTNTFNTNLPTSTATPSTGTPLMTSPAEKYEIAVVKARLRQAKFYAKNKDKLSDKKKADRKALKKCKDKDDIPCTECAMAEAEVEAEVIIPKKTGATTNVENVEQLTLENFLKKLNEIALIEVKREK